MWIILSIFFGLSMLTATVMTGIMFAVGRWTIPGSPQRRLQEAQVDLLIAETKFKAEEARFRLDALVGQRHQLAIEKGDEQ